MRAPSIFSAAFVVLCGGCIYATGVQDYKVDDNASSTGGPGDATCGAQSTFADCEVCCSGHHPDDKRASLDSLRNCACTPDRCQTPCSEPDAHGRAFCDDPLAGFNSSCDSCLSGQIQSGACTVDSGNHYNQCLGLCPQ